MKLKLLYPCDYFNHKEVDEAYAQEMTIAKSLGFDCLLFNYDEFIETKKINLSAVKRCDTIYRGWMLNGEDYYSFNNLLYLKGYILINSDEMYLACHHFNRVYPYLVDTINTPKTIKYYPNINLKEHFTDYFIMKDNVKSVKGTDFPDKISVDIDADEFLKLIDKFVEYRGKLYTGEIILKQYVDLKRYGNATNEWRVFYYYGQVLTTSANSNQPNGVPRVLDTIVNSILDIKPIRSKFFTADFAETESGDWILIETGDGQVSGLSPNQNIVEFYSKIMNFKRD